MGPSRIQCSILIRSIVGSGWSDVTNPTWGVESSCWMVRWCFQTVVIETTLESPLGSKKIKSVNLKWNQPWIFIGRTDAELKFQYFDYLMWRTDSLEKTLVMGKIEGRRRRGDKGRDDWIASLTQQTWVWENSGRQWRTGKPGTL